MEEISPCFFLLKNTKLLKFQLTGRDGYAIVSKRDKI